MKHSTAEGKQLGEIKAADYIEKLRALEERIGAITEYSILSPFRCNPKDAVDLQESAKRIAEFVGLEDLTFIVAVARQKEKIGGHIELEPGQQEVFIEISTIAGRSSEATLAVLAHEISHKLLQRHGISLGHGLLENYENEILTDITAIFVGLGKLMLNGAEAQNETWKGGQREIQSIRTGYLNLQELAFVYRLVCAMRDVRKREMMSGLTPQAKSAIRSCERFKAQFFDPRFRDKDYRQKLVRDLHLSANRFETTLHEVRKQVSLVKRSLIDAPETFLAQAERDVGELGDRLREISATEIYDPSHRFLDTVNLASETRAGHSHLTELAAHTEQWIGELDRALRSCRLRGAKRG